MCGQANPIHIEAVGDHEQWSDHDTRAGNNNFRP
jgi:hypothetical protein